MLTQFAFSCNSGYFALSPLNRLADGAITTAPPYGKLSEYDALPLISS